VKDHEALSRQLKVTEHKVERLERIVEDLVRRVDVMESTSSRPG